MIRLISGYVNPKRKRISRFVHHAQNYFGPLWSDSLVSRAHHFGILLGLRFLADSRVFAVSAAISAKVTRVDRMKPRDTHASRTAKYDRVGK